jgi:hypothetical protein
MEIIESYNSIKINGDDDDDDDEDAASYEIYKQEIENYNLEFNNDDKVIMQEDNSVIYSITSVAYNNNNNDNRLVNQVRSYDDNRILNDGRLIMNLNNFQLYSLKSDKSCFETIQNDIKPCMRKVVVSWMLEVCEEEKCDKLVFPLAVYILDKFLYAQRITKNVFQLVASVCLFLSTKIFNIVPISAERLILFSDFSIDVESLIVSQFFNYLKIN